MYDRGVEGEESDEEYEAKLFHSDGRVGALLLGLVSWILYPVRTDLSP